MIAEVISNSGTLEFRSLAGASAAGLPVGSILALHTTRVPAGYLPCNGAVYDITQYPALYTILQTNVLPDLREANLVGAGANSTHSISTHDTYTVGQFKDDQVQETITGAESETAITDPGHNHTLDSLTLSDQCICGSFSAGGAWNTAFSGGSGAFSVTGWADRRYSTDGRSDGYNTVCFNDEHTHTLTDSCISTNETGITAATTTTITCDANSRTGSVTHGKNYGVFFVIKAVTGITELDDAEVYAQVVNLLESNYIQKSTFTEMGIPYYNCDTGCFSSIDYPASCVNHNVVLTAINGGSCTCTTSAYNLNGTTNYIYGDLTSVPSCISSNWEVTQSDHVESNVVYHNGSYYTCASGDWYPITSINYPSVSCGNVVADSDLIDVLDTCTQTYMDWGSYTYSTTCWDYGWCDAASAVSNLTDVCLSNLCDGQYLQYDAINCTWNNVTLTVDSSCISCNCGLYESKVTTTSNGTSAGTTLNIFNGDETGAYSQILLGSGSIDYTAYYSGSSDAFTNMHQDTGLWRVNTSDSWHSSEYSSSAIICADGHNVVLCAVADNNNGGCILFNGACSACYDGNTGVLYVHAICFI